MLTTTPTVTRHGRVLLSRGSLPGPGYEEFLVREWSDGDIEYYIGVDLCIGGWALLPDSVDRSDIVWES